MIRVLLADDQQVIRVGLRAILEAQPDLTVVADVEDGLQAVRLVEKGGIDVVLMDIRMPRMDGVEATKQIRERISSADVKIVVLTTFEQDETVLGALRAGANGFLGKAVGPTELAAAIREVAAGGGALSAAAQSALIGHVTDGPRFEPDPELADRFRTLTARELEMVLAAAKGFDNDQIGKRTFLSPLTVKTHVNRAMAKVGARDRAQLVAFAYRAGVVA